MRIKRIQSACYLLFAGLLTIAGGYAGAASPTASSSKAGEQHAAASNSSLPAGYYAMPGNESRSDFNLPQIGMAGANVLSPQQEYQIGVQIMNQARQAGVIVNDPLIHEYIDNLGHELSSHSDDPTLHFEYFVVNDPEINAITLPGGFVGVFTGLILETDSEDELAGVMAHETAHVTQRHIARSAEDQKNHSLLDLATILGSILVAASSGDPNVAIGALATAQGSIIQHQITFTRSQEEEADRVGIQTLARAGFPPQGMIEFFKKMEQDSVLNGYNHIPEFLLDHPQDSTRMAYLEERALSMRVPPRPDSRSYAIMKARVRVLVSDNPNKTLEYFRNGVATTSGWNQEAMRYGLALSDILVGRDKEAVEIMRVLADKYSDIVAFRIGLANAQMTSGDIKTARVTYAQALQLFPDSKPLILSYANDLIEADLPQEAISLLIPQTLHVDNDPEIIRMLAKAYERAGDEGDSHYYMSEYYYSTGLPAAAADQLRIALATPGIDGMQRQRYQARLQRLEAWGRANRQSLVTQNNP
ncbi:MAG: M48 family metallopeptidase [Gammaproteobacteria bacterium]|nr:M48 family metallopeptidase [Gammaproteobacteria bacterium]